MQHRNPLLQQTVQQIQAKVPPDLMPTFQRIVLAGEKVMYAPQTHAMMVNQLKGNPNQAEAVGEGIAKLFAILLHESKGTLNMKAAMPAMVVLLCDALDFMEQTMGVKVTPQLLAAATKEMGSALLQVMGVTPDKLNQMMAKVQQQQAPAQPGGIVSSATGG
jgi:hypothetical protein